MPPERVPTDVLGDDLVATYRSGISRLEGLIAAGLRRGLDPSRAHTPAAIRGDATAEYRRRQLSAAKAVLAELEQHGRRRAPVIAAGAYRSALLAVDRVTVGEDRGLTGRFGGLHQRAVEVLASNLTGTLERAVATVSDNLDAVFARAELLDGALTPGGGPLAGFPFIGRRIDDPWRRVALETIGQGTITLETRRQISASLERRLISEGVTDALTGYVDRAGRRWGLGDYAEMVVRTTTREATSTATIGRLVEHGLGLVAISTHEHKADECTPFDGRTFAIPGTDAAKRGGYPLLTRQPPFHPRCRHVARPADSSFDGYIGELERAAQAVRVEEPGASPATRLPLKPTDELADPPFGGRATPDGSPQTAGRLDAQRAVYSDPGPEEGAAEAWARHVELEDRRARRQAKLALGEDLTKYIRRQWGREAGIEARFMAGELSVEDVENLAYEEYQAAEERRLSRELDRERDYGFRRQSCPCFSCGRLKRRPSDVCDYCGDDPVSMTNAEYYGGTDAQREVRAKFDRAYGYSGT